MHGVDNFKVAQFIQKSIKLPAVHAHQSETSHAFRFDSTNPSSLEYSE